MENSIETKYVSVHGHMIRLARFENSVWASAHDVATAVGYKRSANSHIVSAVLADSGIGTLKKKVLVMPDTAVDHWWDNYALAQLPTKTRKDRWVATSITRSVIEQMSLWKNPVQVVEENEVKSRESVSYKRQGKKKPKIVSFKDGVVEFEGGYTPFKGKMTETTMNEYSLAAIGAGDPTCDLTGERFKEGDTVISFTVNRNGEKMYGRYNVLKAPVEIVEEKLSEEVNNQVSKVRPTLDTISPNGVTFKEKEVVCFSGNISKKVLNCVAYSNRAAVYGKVICDLSGKEIHVGDEVYQFYLNRPHYYGNYMVLVEEVDRKKSWFQKILSIFK